MSEIDEAGICENCDLPEDDCHCEYCEGCDNLVDDCICEDDGYEEDDS